MLLKSIRRMRGPCFTGGWWRWTHHFLLVIWLSLLAASLPKAHGYFLGDTKAVLNGCEDHWTLQDRAAMPMLFQMTLCVDIRVVVPGAWVAFSYSSVHAPRPELGLEGDEEALYGWLLRVRHRFPIQLSPTHWHRVCLRRDALRNSFSLEVDGNTVAERTVIAQAIPPSGSLWLGCRPRDRPPGATLGQVELYLFRMWADLGHHDPCEDGTVIGWNTQHWGVTSPRARERDPSLQCADHRQLRRGARVHRAVTDASQPGAERSFTPPPVSSTTTTSAPVTATSAAQMSHQTPDITGSSSSGNTVRSSQTEPPSVAPSANHSRVEKSSDLQNSTATDWTSSNTSVLPFTALPVSDTSTQTSPNTSLDQTTPGGTLTSGYPFFNCTTSQLCSNDSAYYWMSISMKARGNNTEQYVHNLMSKTFGCHGVKTNRALGVTGFIDFCQSDRQLQAVQVNCSSSSIDRQTTCEVVLQLSGAVSACDLQQVGVSALQQAGHQQTAATITGELERVGRGVCGGVQPSSGRFVRCTSSLDDICRANKHSDLTCSLIEPHSNPAPLNRSQSCSSEAPRFCDCTSFCNSSSQFFAVRININSSSVNVTTLRGLLSGSSLARLCNTSGSVCEDILKHYQRPHLHLECHGTQQRLSSCMVTLEMSGPVSSCSLEEFLHQVIDATSGITIERPLSRMVVCGPPGSTVHTLLASNLTWVSSDLLTSDLCQPHPTLSERLTCEADENLAVLLTESCPAGKLILALRRNPSSNMTTSPPRVNAVTATINSTADNTTKPTAAALNKQAGDPKTVTETENHTTTTATTVNLPTTNTSLEATASTTRDPGTISTSETTISQEALQELADRLLNQTQDASQLNSSQVEQLVSELEKLLDRPTVSREVGQKVVSVVSNLMEADPQALSASSRSLVGLVDDLGLKLVVTGDKEILSSRSLILAVGVVDGTNFPVMQVDIFNTDNVQLQALHSSRSKRSGFALGSVFLPSSLTMGLSPEQQRQANRVQFNFYTKSTLFKDTASLNETRVSPVLAASVANLSISNLTENIQYTIRHTSPAPENFVASCAFWDTTQNGGVGGWGDSGCFVVNATTEETTCSCNHLTSFAILLDLSREGIFDRQHAQILTYITYIGCGISVIFLAVTLLTYLSFDKLRRDIPAKILVQLSLSLLLLNLVFLLDGWLALYPAIGLCISTAFFLHYFLLTSFTWAGLGALHMYLSIVRVFTPYLSRYMLKLSLIGWGVPLIVVIIVISVDKDNYGLVTYGRFTDGTTDDFCWLRNDIAFYVGVVAYFLLIFVMCLLVFVDVMVQLYRIKRQNPHNQSPNRGIVTDVRRVVGIIILLGLTWGFALFAWGPAYIPFVYLFSIFNSLQGFFVFIFHCALKESVRKQWRIYLCCGRLRLAENTEWSRTATQRRNRNFSDVTATSSAPQLASRSISVTSDVTNSSDSVFADSGISEGSSTFLSEIHRRTLSPVSSNLQYIS